MLGDALRTRAKLFDRPVPPRDADDRDVQMAAASHRVQRGKDLLVGEIARCPKQDQRVRLRLRHESSNCMRRAREAMREWASTGCAASGLRLGDSE